MDTINRIVENNAEIEPVYKKKRGIVLLRRVDNLIFVSGHGPEDQITGVPLFRGRIGADLTPEEGYRAARECAIIILGALKDTLGNLDKIDHFVKAFGLVNCAEGFHDVDGVMDGFSDTIADVLEERGYHARTAMGTHNLPNNNIPVEIEVIVSVKD
ncbi:RidA family protein [Hydrogenoanaerobacterium sp.]|uniref:RidA family protein n=1 Tax=Hydrogenoanaerobacterium sp. TaxID=2953763 RepID=UPI002899A409|nr:RidA family protein [Hydrogenoanaerobacterium sp.]